MTPAIHYLRELQPLLLALLLLGACAAKMSRVLRARSVLVVLDASAMFPPRLRRGATMAVCATELSLGAALVLTTIWQWRAAAHAGFLRGREATASHAARAAPQAAAHVIQGAVRTAAAAAHAVQAAQAAQVASSVAERAGDHARFGAAVFFLMGMCALAELRGHRPDLGCGCFGNLSVQPPGARSIARTMVLAGLALAGIDSRPLSLPDPGPQSVAVLGLLLAEILLLAAISPEAGEALARMGSSEPCEIRVIPRWRVLTALRRSAAWAHYGPWVTSGTPADMWRELCWSFVVYPARHDGRECELVFAVEMKPRRPRVQAAVVNPEPAGPPGSGGSGGPGVPAVPGTPAGPQGPGVPGGPGAALPAPVPSAIF